MARRDSNRSRSPRSCHGTARMGRDRRGTARIHKLPAELVAICRATRSHHHDPVGGQDRLASSRHRRAFGILDRGEVSEWLMVPLSKSGVRKHRGFESRPLRQHSSRRTGRRDPTGPSVSGERSPSGLWRRTGNAVRGNPSRVRIPPSPPSARRGDDPGRCHHLRSLGRSRRPPLLSFPGRARRGTSGAL